MRFKRYASTSRFENLESRAMLTGTVKVIGGAFLQLLGDDAGNNIVVHQVGKFSQGGVSIEIDGIGTKLLVAKPSMTTGNPGTGETGSGSPGSTGSPTEFFPPTNSVVISSVGSIWIKLAGGNDSLVFSNTTLSGTFAIDMGSGNDSLTMMNVHALFPGFVPPPGILLPTIGSTMTIDLGSGNDVANLSNVSAAVDLRITGGDGHDMVNLNHVVAGTNSSQFLTSHFDVDMGLGNMDALTVIACSGDQASFVDTGGSGGLLLRSRNHFNNEVDTGFALVV